MAVIPQKQYFHGKKLKIWGICKDFIRGINKMELRCGLALIIMPGMAYGRVKEKQPEKLRSLVQPAA